MAITITLDGDYTLDESSGLQTGADGTPSGTPTDDSDVDVTTLPTENQRDCTASINSASYAPNGVAFTSSPSVNPIRAPPRCIILGP